MSFRFSLVIAFFISFIAAAAEPKPPPFITPYPGQQPYGSQFSFDFDEHWFITGKTKGNPPPGPEFKKVEGKVSHFTFDIPSGRSKLEVFKNYEQGLKKAGFDILYTCKGKECGAYVDPMPGWKGASTRFIPADGEERYLLAKLDRPEGTVWVDVYLHMIGLELLSVHVVEEKAMETDKVKVDAAALKKGLEDNGYIAVYGIEFDTGKATLKPSSAPAFAEVKKLLDGNPALKLYVVGHTDDVGAESCNVTLSNARAAAVVLELTTKHGIKKERLKSYGVGPYVPVASNKSDAGRAKNRRVVLVKDVP